MSSLCFFLLVFLVHSEAQSCGHRNVQQLIPYVVGGSEAGKNEFPWQVSLQIYGKTSEFRFATWNHYCGGSIINDRWIITAAHCIMRDVPQANQRIVLGAHDLSKSDSTMQTLKIEYAIVHAHFNLEKVENDIALIRVSQNLRFNSAVGPICLPEVNETKSFESATCVTSGWGRVSNDAKKPSEVLLKVDLPIVSDSVCKSRYRNFKTVIDESKVCAGNLEKSGSGVCQGDSGGPLVSQKDGVYKLVGITSFGVVCGSATHPAVFTRVAHYRSWIDANLKTYS